MEFFRELLAIIGTNTDTTMQFDFISNLPIEIAQHLLRLLDSRSLFNASSVSKKWLSVCKGDILLRQSIRAQLQTKRRQLLQNINISRSSSKSSHDAVSQKTKVIRGNYYTRGDETAGCNFYAPFDGQKKYQKPLNKSGKSRVTRSLAKLR